MTMSVRRPGKISIENTVVSMVKLQLTSIILMLLFSIQDIPEKLPRMFSIRNLGETADIKINFFLGCRVVKGGRSLGRKVLALPLSTTY